MRPDRKKSQKLYYSIKEVAAMVGVSEPTLRFWEKEFPRLAPLKSDSGVRRYTLSDIEQVKAIRHLVKLEGMTLKGARRVLGEHGDRLQQNLSVADRLRALRADLLQICSELDAL